MLRLVQVHRYRVFERTEVSLGPLTVFVGPNASGKSALLRACVGGDFSARDVRHHRGRGSIQRYYDAPAPGAEFQTQGPTGRASLRFRDGLVLPTADVPEPLAPSLPRRGPLLHLDAGRLREACTVQRELELAPDGANLANVFATIARRDQQRLVEAYCELVPVFSDVDVRPTDVAGQHRLVFQDRWQPDLWYEPEDVSDGSLYALALLTLRYQPARPTLVAIEDPEHGLHPYLLGDLLEVMRRLAEDEEHPIQFVLATHSAELLEHLQPTEVRFLRRDASGRVDVVEPDPEQEHWRKAYEAHQRSMGSLWLAGGLGGVP